MRSTSPRHSTTSTPRLASSTSARSRTDLRPSWPSGTTLRSPPHSCRFMKAASPAAASDSHRVQGGSNMFSTSGSTSIDRPAAEVFAFIADVRNDPRWHTDVLAAKLIEGTAVDRHSMFEIETKPVMGVSRGKVAVSQYEPPSRIVFDVRMGKLQPTTTFTVVPDATGCRVTRRIDVEPQGLMGVMAPVMGGWMSRRNDALRANLRRLRDVKAATSVLERGDALK